MSDAMSSFSVIVTAHNNEKVILRTLQSVEAAISFLLDRDKTFKDIKREIVVVDDGSADNTYSALLSYAKDKSIYKIIHRENSSSPSCARNTGANQATG